MQVNIYSPISGNIIDIKTIPDKMFSDEVIGPSIAIRKHKLSEFIYSPIDGIDIAVYPTGHAVVIEHESGLELLIHIGIDTYKKEGLFEIIVNNHEIVSEFDKLLRINPLIQDSSSDLIIITVVKKEGFVVQKLDNEFVVAKKSILMKIDTGVNDLIK
jgi:Phosphotransferase system IIA components